MIKIINKKDLPLKEELIFEGEIKNKPKNKTNEEFILDLWQEDFPFSLDKIEGNYLLAFLKENKIYLATDLLGLRPCWYSFSPEGFAFASERKFLEKEFSYLNQLNPRKILVYNLENNSLDFIKREFLRPKTIKIGFEEAKKRLDFLLTKAIKERIPHQEFGLLFSGGIDSAFLALKLKELGHQFNCYTCFFDAPEIKTSTDFIFAGKIARELDLNLKTVKISLEAAKKEIKKVVEIIEDPSPLNVEIALPIYFALKSAKEKDFFYGFGSEELFIGYQRYLQAEDKTRSCYQTILNYYQNDLYCDYCLSQFFKINLIYPYLDQAAREFALSLPEEYKLNNGINKFILRSLAEDLGLRKEFAFLKKTAAQYGSNSSKAVSKLSKKEGFLSKKDYLRKFYKPEPLAALFTGGKDSLFALYLMLKQKYNVKCLITLRSRNPFSYMFHTPAIEITDLQAKSLDLPLLIKETKGEKEKELIDLEKALQEAKEALGIKGAITGALFSNYQKERIEKVCHQLNLKVFSPLWHLPQEIELKELLNNGFKFVMTKISAQGLEEDWLMKEIDKEKLEKLIKLSQRFGFNLSGEGGEYETLVLDSPLFKKKLIIKEYQIIKEGPFSAYAEIKKAEW